MCEICEWGKCDQCETLEDCNANVVAAYREVLARAEADTNWPWTERNELEEWTPEDGYEDEYADTFCACVGGPNCCIVRNSAKVE